MKQKKLHFAWIVFIGWCVLALVGQGMVLNTGGMYLLPIGESLGVSQGQVSMALTLQMLLMAGIFPIAAKLITAVPFKPLMGGTVVLMAGGLFLASTANSIGVLYVAQVLVGATSGMVMLSRLILGNWFREKLGTVMGVVAAIAGLGGAVWNPIVSVFIENFGWRGSYRLCALILLVVLLPVVALTLRYAPAKGETAYGEAPQAAGAQTMSATMTEGMTMKEAFRSLPFYLVFAASLLLSAATGITQQTVPQLVATGHTVAVAATVMVTLGVGSAIGKFALGFLLDAFKPSIALTLYTALGVAGNLGIAYVTNNNLLYILGFCFGAGQAVMQVAVPYFTRKVVGGKDIARISGVSGIITAVFPAAAMVFAGMSYDATGNYSIPFMLAGMAALISCPLILTGYSMHKRRAARPKEESAPVTAAGATAENV